MLSKGSKRSRLSRSLSILLLHFPDNMRHVSDEAGLVGLVNRTRHVWGNRQTTDPVGSCAVYTLPSILSL